MFSQSAAGEARNANSTHDDDVKNVSLSGND